MLIQLRYQRRMIRMELTRSIEPRYNNTDPLSVLNITNLVTRCDISTVPLAPRKRVICASISRLFRDMLVKIFGSIKKYIIIRLRK
mmetsp:Transcript_2244/g.2505  ORF Transcript_2244/g.2505 Transcript_2244/m.2505 type:complete len:86 (-) Transcript_2244:588-845(-)